MDVTSTVASSVFTLIRRSSCTSALLYPPLRRSIEKYKSFVYGEARWCEGKKGQELEIPIQARQNSKAVCSGCGKKRHGYELHSITSIGIDEIQYRRGHKYLTLVYQLDEGTKRLLYLAKDRTEESLKGFFFLLSEETNIADEAN